MHSTRYGAGACLSRGHRPAMDGLAVPVGDKLEAQWRYQELSSSTTVLCSITNDPNAARAERRRRPTGLHCRRWDLGRQIRTGLCNQWDQARPCVLVSISFPVSAKTQSSTVPRPSCCTPQSAGQELHSAQIADPVHLPLNMAERLASATHSNHTNKV